MYNVHVHTHTRTLVPEGETCHLRELPKCLQTTNTCCLEPRYGNLILLDEPGHVMEGIHVQSHYMYMYVLHVWLVPTSTPTATYYPVTLVAVETFCQSSCLPEPAVAEMRKEKAITCEMAIGVSTHTHTHTHVRYSYILVTSVHWPLGRQCTEVTRCTCNYHVSCSIHSTCVNCTIRFHVCVHNQIVYEIVTRAHSVCCVCGNIFN